MIISGSVSATDLPLRVVVDHHGHYWRDYGDYLSMCPVSDENNEMVVAAVYVREVCDVCEVREDEARHD